jgi:hypothetical protein
MLVIVKPPGFNRCLGIGELGELVDVQTLVSQAAVKRFNEGVLHRFTRPNEVEWHASAIGPIFERPLLEFRPMIHRDRSWSRSFAEDTFEGSADSLTRHPKTGL